MYLASKEQRSYFWRSDLFQCYFCKIRLLTTRSISAASETNCFENLSFNFFFFLTSILFFEVTSSAQLLCFFYLFLFASKKEKEKQRKKSLNKCGVVMTIRLWWGYYCGYNTLVGVPILESFNSYQISCEMIREPKNMFSPHNWNINYFSQTVCHRQSQYINKSLSNFKHSKNNHYIRKIYAFYFARRMKNLLQSLHALIGNITQ